MKKLIGLAAFTVLAAVALGSTGQLSPLISSDYLPHRFCYLAKPGLIWTNVAMDSVIAASYALIFASLMWVAHRLRHTRELRSYLWILTAFATFIGACGATHVMEVITVWWPVYPLSAAVKVVCALASIPTALIFARQAPRLAVSVIRFVEIEAELREVNEELLEFSAIDALTQLRNRGSFDTFFSAEWARATRTGLPLAVLMMDIDYFKRLNDRYGHLAGDQCLRRVAQVLSERRGRPEDLIARYGGDEFAMILPGASLADARKIAEEMRCAVSALGIPNEDAAENRFVTLSIGVASHKPKFPEFASGLLATADAALYRAKAEGRNRTECGNHANRLGDNAPAGPYLTQNNAAG